MELLENGILADESVDKMACQIAYEISLDSKPILQVPYHDSLHLGELATSRVVRGLVRISLEEPDYDYSGLSPLDAQHQLIELYGIDEIARVSLEAPGYVHESGLSQADADMLVNRMCGSADDAELALLT